MLQSGSVHQVIDFLSFTLGLVVSIVSSIYRGIGDLLPAPAWMAIAAAVFALVLHARLRSRIEELEGTLVQLEAKVDTLLARIAHPRTDLERRDGGDTSG
jgi:hypothetical protein